MNVKAPRTTAASPTSLDASGWPGSIAPAAVLPDEDGTEYAKFTARFLAAVKPRDFIEEILARDAIDLSWEILRLRRLKIGLLRMACGDGVRSVVEKLDTEPSAPRWNDEFCARWMSGHRMTRNEFRKLLKRSGLGMEDVMAEALSSKIMTFERFDHMAASAEARRNNALREIDRHRSALGAAMRQVIDEVEDAEFRDVETGEMTRGPPP